MKFSLKKLFTTKRNLFFILFSVLLLILVFIFDLAYPSQNSIHKKMFWTKEVMIVIASFLLAVVVYRRQFEEEKNIIYKLKTFFFSILGLLIAIAVPKVLFSSNLFASFADYVPIITKLQENLINTFLAIFVTLFLIINLFWLLDLVYYKSKRGTQRLLKLALTLLIANIVYGHYAHNISEADFLFLGRTHVEWVILGSLLITIILLSLRTSWVNYLNKRQKVLTFWGGLLVLPGIFLFFLKSNTLQTIERYSFTLERFDTPAVCFLGIYIVFAEISILLHLPTASIFDKRMKDIASLQNLSRIISSVLNYDEVVSKVNALTQDVLKSDACWLEMVNGDGNLEIVSSHNLTRNEIEDMQVSKDSGVSGWIFKNRSSFLVNDILKDNRTKYLQNYHMKIGSILGVPLISQKKVTGILFAIKNDIFGFDQDDGEMLKAFANQAVVAIENARLVEGSLEKERLEQELRVAHDTQVKLLPKEMPQMEGLAIDALCKTANEVGGDYYDFIHLDDTKLGVVIADVSGKGLSAAFYMAELKGIVNAFAKLYYSPRLFLQKVNETLYENVDKKTFVSMIYAVFDMKKGKITFCRAGHCPLVYYDSKKDKISILKPGGIGVALDSSGIFNKTLQECEIKWHDQDLFLFFTDGLTEARDSDKNEYGEDRVIEIVKKCRKLNVEAIQKNIIQDVTEFIGETSQHDDLSLICTKIQFYS